MSTKLLSALTPLVLGASVAAGAAIDDDSAIIDMAGYEGVILLTTIDDSTATGIASLIVEQNSENNAAGMAALADAIATLTSAADDDLNGRILAVDIYQPQERFLRVNRTSSGANIAFGSVIALRYGARKAPIEVDDSVGHLVLVSSPDEA